MTPAQDRRRPGPSHAGLAHACALLILIALPCASAGATSVVSPLPASNYTVRPVCAAPAPRHAGCLALRLVPITTAARARTHPLGMTRSRPIVAAEAAEGAFGLRPQDLRSAYFPGEQPEAPASEPQTIALVDAYNDPSAEADLEVYDREFKLPECTGLNKCFEKVNQNGSGETTNLPFPKSPKEQKAEEATCESTTATEAEKEAACGRVEEAEGWALETSTDIEVSHAICQNCRIVLVETNSAGFPDLEAAENAAVTLGATEISNSWGGEEPLLDSKAFKHPGTVITAASGDSGYLNWISKGKPGYFAGADYPASSPHVIAVGGTKLTLSGGARQSETVWNDGEVYGAAGGGCSERFTAQPWQQEISDWTAVGCGSERAVADVSADADPLTGVAVYDSVPYPTEEGTKTATALDWVPIGGTSVASPIIASMFALAGGSHGITYPAQTLYSRLGSPPGAPSLYDVTKGGNGKCDAVYPLGGCSGSMTPLSPLDCGKEALICDAAPGYDGPTGAGAPNGVVAFKPESEAEHAQRVAAEKKAAEEKLALEEQKAKEAKQKQEEEARAAEASKAEEERRAAEKKTREEEEASSRSSSGGGSSGKGGGEAEASNSAGAGGGFGGFPSGASNGPGGSGRTLVHLSRLGLTPSALLALRRVQPKVFAVDFTFTLSAAARIRVTLAKRVEAHERKRWQTLPYSLMIAGSWGRNHRRLASRNTLTPGRYRLTLTPVHGAARTLTFTIG